MISHCWALSGMSSLESSAFFFYVWLIFVCSMASCFQLVVLVVHSGCILKEIYICTIKNHLAKEMNKLKNTRCDIEERYGKHAVMKGIQLLDREQVNIHSTSARRPT